MFANEARGSQVVSQKILVLGLELQMGSELF